VVIPLEADKFSVEGLKRLLDAIEKMRLVNRRLAVEGVLINLYNGRRAIEQKAGAAREHFVELIARRREPHG
jgi:cellulose biosynthesis protein BcsQ